MIVALFCILDGRLDVGFGGDAQPQSSFALEYPLTALRLHKVLLDAVTSLLVSPSAISAVIVEPPLFSLDTKQCIAEVLLAKLKVASVGFLQRSVCCVAGIEQPGNADKEQSRPGDAGTGLIVDSSEELVVPVYDYRELTPFIRTTVEFPMQTTIDLVIQSLAIDIRMPVKSGIIHSKNNPEYDLGVWQGASALLACRKVWPLLTREKYKQGTTVWDSLYDMR